MDKNLLSLQMLKEVNELIFAKTGLDFRSYEPISLRNRVSRILRQHQIDSVQAFRQRLRQEDRFFTDYVDAIMVGMTSMFRDPEVWQQIREHVLPQIPKNRSGQTIWHAGCSTGEEPYSMAILLKEANTLYSTTIIATDLSQEYLGIAQSGTYTIGDYRKYRSNYHQFNHSGQFDAFFSHQAKTVTIRKELKARINFRQHNLATPWTGPKADLIFCRNVLIYFDAALKAKVWRMLAGNLNSGGFLVIGNFDTPLLDAHENLQPILQNGRIFQKM